MSSRNKLQLFRHLLHYTPPLIKFIVTDGNNNASICVVLNNEIFMDSSHPNISLDAVNEACSALSIALDTDAVIIEKKCNESDILMDWRDFKSELDAYIDDCLVNDGAMPVEFEYNYEDIVFDFDEYQHFINFDESERHNLKIADSESETSPLFAEIYRRETGNLAMCLNLNTADVTESDFECTRLILHSKSLKKMVVLYVSRIQLDTDDKDNTALFYITFIPSWVETRDKIALEVPAIKQIGYSLSCDPVKLMQADDVVGLVDIPKKSPAFKNNVEKLELRTFKAIRDDERNIILLNVK